MSLFLQSLARGAASGVPNYPAFPAAQAVQVLNNTAAQASGNMQDALNALSGFNPQQIGSPAQISAQNVNYVGAAQKAINFNATNMDLFKNMATDFNNRQANDRMAAIRASAPEFDAIRGQQAAVIQSNLAGEVGAQAQSEIARSAAFKNLQGGTTGSMAGKGISARDLGLASAGLQQMGMASAENWNRTIADILPMPISGAQIMQFSGISADRAITAETESARLKQAAAEFNAGSVNAANQFNVSQANQYNLSLQQARANVSLQAAQQAMALGATNLGIIDATHNARVGQMNQKEKSNTLLWETRAAATPDTQARVAALRAAGDAAAARARRNQTAGIGVLRR